MNLVVCIKPIKSMFNDSLYSGYKLAVSNQDLDTLHQAIRLKESKKDEKCSIIVVAMSSMAANDSLTQLYEYGIDQVYLLSNNKYAGADTIATAYTLGQFLHNIEYDFIFTSFQSSDSETGFLPPALAEELGICCLTNVELDHLVSDKDLFVKRFYENDIISIRVGGKAVLSIHPTGEEMKRPCFREILQNRKEVCIVSDLMCDESKVGMRGSRTRVECIEKREMTSRQGVLYEFQKGMSILEDYLRNTSRQAGDIR